MRRAIAAAVLGGLVLGGAAVTPALAAARNPGAAGAARKTTPATKTVVYRGYEFRVPATWPVYRLDQNPSLCVRYDIHAVYLGTPGANMRCPAGLIGRTQAVSFIPGATQPAQPAGASGVALRRLPAVHAAITQNAAAHELRVALGTAVLGATVLGTYGADPAVVEQILGSLRNAPSGAAATGQSGAAQRLARPSAGRGQLVIKRAARPAAASGGRKNGPASAAAKTPAPGPTYTSWRGLPPNWPVQIVQPAPPVPPKSFRAVFGFDTCTAPSLATMKVWRKKYAAVGIYIGGVNAACPYGNLSASWVRATAGRGYGFLPTYVGPQAPCWNGNGLLIDPSQARAEGAAAASDAASDARFFGLPPGSPVFYDMEAYSGGTSCTNAVLAFIGAWDRQLAAAGYVSAVYSSQDSGIVDLQAATAGRAAGFTPPRAIWIALWDNVATLSDGTLAWPLSMRVKQYAGNVSQTVGGITLDIDRDIVGGPLAR